MIDRSCTKCDFREEAETRKKSRQRSFLNREEVNELTEGILVYDTSQPVSISWGISGGWGEGVYAK